MKVKLQLATKFDTDKRQDMVWGGVDVKAKLTDCM